MIFYDKVEKLMTELDSKENQHVFGIAMKLVSRMP
jgi:hypothetical protein